MGAQPEALFLTAPAGFPKLTTTEAGALPMPSETPELHFPSLWGPHPFRFFPLTLSFPSSSPPPLPHPFPLPPSHLSSDLSVQALLSSFPLLYLPFSSLGPPSSLPCPSFSFLFTPPPLPLPPSSTPSLPSHFLCPLPLSHPFFPDPLFFSLPDSLRTSPFLLTLLASHLHLGVGPLSRATPPRSVRCWVQHLTCSSDASGPNDTALFQVLGWPRRGLTHQDTQVHVHVSASATSLPESHPTLTKNSPTSNCSGGAEGASQAGQWVGKTWEEAPTA